MQQMLDGENLSQAQIAREIHKSRTTVNKWVKGKQRPNIKDLVHIARRTNGSLDALFGVSSKTAQHAAQHAAAVKAVKVALVSVTDSLAQLTAALKRLTAVKKLNDEKAQQK